MSTTVPEANDFLMGSGVKPADFPDRAYGTTWTGTICEQPTVQQQTDLKDGSLKFWKSDGKPMMMLICIVQTEVRDPQIIDDDGKRAFYIKAKLQQAVRDAVRKSGAKGLEIGGTLTVTYTGDGTPTGVGMNPPKLYSAAYTPASAVQANEALMGTPAPAQHYAPPAPAPQPAYVPPAPAPVAQAAPATQQAPTPTAVSDGVDPQLAAALAMLTPEQKRQMGIPVGPVA